MAFHVYRTTRGVLVNQAGHHFLLTSMDWDDFVNRDGLFEFLQARVARMPRLTDTSIYATGDLLPPIGRQEVWAAGVTYFRSRTARMEEASNSSGEQFYERVYEAERPELFFKSMPDRVVGPGGMVRIRRDSKWNVPEPELTLMISTSGKIIGYTVGNDMSSRSIEGENPLYLPQAKMYDGSAALGPCLFVPDEPLSPATRILLEIRREGGTAFSGNIHIKEMKRKPEELVDYLYRATTFPHGCYLMTGTGIVPPSNFTLMLGDEIRITIAPIGTLVNRVALTE